MPSTAESIGPPYSSAAWALDFSWSSEGPDVREDELADARLVRVDRRLARRHVERQEVVAVLPGRLGQEEVRVLASAST
jgi:hypothetical protein